jgi:hypothetical protein
MPETIEQFWNFDNADLGANRLGQLTEKQRKYLLGEHKTQKNVFLGVGASLVVLFLCLPIVLIGSRVILPMLLAGDFSEIQSIFPFAAIGGFGILFIGTSVLAVGAAVAIYMLRAGKKADISVKRVESEVNYSWGTKRVRNPGNKARPYDDIRVLHLNIDGKKYEVHKDLQEIIKEGERWAIYYTSYPFKFLSAEQVK